MFNIIKRYQILFTSYTLFLGISIYFIPKSFVSYFSHFLLLFSLKRLFQNSLMAWKVEIICGVLPMVKGDTKLTN